MCTQVAFNLEHGPIRAASFKILVEDFVKVCRIRAGGGGGGGCEFPSAYTFCVFLD